MHDKALRDVFLKQNFLIKKHEFHETFLIFLKLMFYNLHNLYNLHKFI